jgi:murein tripeptide amidase MpaA
VNTCQLSKQLNINCIAFIFTLIVTPKLFSQVPAEKNADYYLNSRDEVYFKFPAGGQNINLLTRIISIDNLKDDTVYAYANRKEFERFSELNIPIMVLIPPGLQKPVKMSLTAKDMKDWNSYPSYGAYLDLMSNFASNYPALCQIYEIDTSLQGRKLLFAKISDNVTQKEAEPEFMFTSSIHGDELTGYILCLHLIDYLLSNYGTDPLVTRLIDSVEIWINPLANPDGTYFGGNDNITGARRENANGADLNRNFPDPDTTDGPDPDHPDGEAWQPETQAMMNFIQAHDFVFSANYHGGSEVMNYPWDTWFKRHPDDTWFQNVSLNYADTAKKYGGQAYFSDPSPNGITDGYDWYTIAGGRQDYMTYFGHGREITIEVSGIKIPDTTELPVYWDYNRSAMLHYIENCLYGIRGIITDSVTHEPLHARVEIIGHDADSSHIYSDLANGNYHRMIAPGTWNLKFSATGYKDKIIEDVVVNNYTSQVWLNVALAVKDSGPVNLHEQNAGIFQCRIDQNLTLLIDLPEEGKMDISVFDLNGKVMYHNNTFRTSGRSAIQLPYNDLTHGIYFCRINFKGSTQTVKISR